MKPPRFFLALVFATAPAAAAAPAAAVPPTAATAPADVPHPLRLSFISSSAFGVTHAKFFNQLLGARLDYRFSPRFAFGGALSYANLKGKDGRVSNVLPEVTTEYRVPLNKEVVGMPFQLALGFLPKNGPTLRLATGFDVAASDKVSFELIPLEPMIWITRERTEVSMNAHVGIRIAF